MSKKLWAGSQLPGGLVCAIVALCLVPSLNCRESTPRQDVAGQTRSAAQEIRRSVLAGSWYPADAGTLAAEVDGYLRQARSVHIGGKLAGLIAPHAGYRYSGAVAASAYTLLRDSGVRTVVLIGPSHRYPFRGFSVYEKGGFETPLGVVPVNEGMARELMSRDSLVAFIREAHSAEHCLEIQLPFLQSVLRDFDIVPIVIGPYCTFDECRHLADILGDLLRSRQDAVIVASSDMSHYPSYDDAEKCDHRMLEAVQSFDVERVMQTDERIMKAGIPNLSCTYCGLEAVLITLMAARRMGADTVDILHYANSGDTPFGDRSKVVGYGAVAMYSQKETGDGRMEYAPLDEQAQQVLLRMARQAIESQVRTGQAPVFRPELPVLGEKRGVFVTITIDDMLRGCIGYHGNDIPLYELVPDRAIAAAVKDGRFLPLSVEELGLIKIKVSVYLSNVYRIDSVDEFELGAHGIILRKGDRGATFLPEVPVEAGWTKDEEMEHLCRKAGLPAGAWKEGAELYVYKTQVFGEK